MFDNINYCFHGYSYVLLSIFNMSSYRKPAIQNDLPKLTKVKFAIFFTKTLTKNP